MKTWTTKNGDEILISGMSDAHLMNSIKMIERKAKDGLVVTLSGGFADKDEFQTGEVKVLEGEEVFDYIKEYDFLCEEARSRGYGKFLPKRK